MTAPKAGLLRIVCVSLAVVVLGGGCGLPLFSSFEPSTRLSPPPGEYDGAIQVTPDRGDDARFFWTTDPSARLEDFEEMDEIHVDRDLSFRYYAISSRGIRSPIVEAVYTIADGAPVIDVKAIGQRNTTFYSYQIQWPMVAPGRAQDFGVEREIPFDESEWYDLEYAIYSSERDDIDSISAAIANGRREMGWFGYHDLGEPMDNPGDWPYYSAMRPGERRFFNVFTRDPNGNTAAYGTRPLASRPALSVYVGVDDTGDDEVHLHDAIPSVASFSRRQLSNPAAPYIRAVDLGRIDSDPYEDLAVVRSDGTTDYYRWYRAKGDGTFNETMPMAEVHSWPQSPNPRQIRIADMTGDGTPELVYNTALRELRVSTVTGAFLTAFPADAEGFTVGDVDNDGLADIVSYGIPNANVRVWLNDGGGAFTEVLQPWSGTPGPGGLNPRDVQLADLDNDGNLDLVVAVAGAVSPNPSVHLAYGQGDGTFVEATDEGSYWGAAGTQAVAIVDFNRDGHPDLFFSNDTPPSLVYINNGDRTFSTGPDTGSASAASGAVAADMNGDGWPDIVENHAGDIRIWLNQDGTAINTTPVVIVPINAMAMRRYAVGQVR